MLPFGFGTTILFVTVLSYIIFVFLSESFNPWQKPANRGLRHRRWLFARSISIVFWTVALSLSLLDTLPALAPKDKLIPYIAIGVLGVAATLLSLIRLLRQPQSGNNKSAQQNKTAAVSTNTSSKAIAPLETDSATMSGNQILRADNFGSTDVSRDLNQQNRNRIDNDAESIQPNRNANHELKPQDLSDISISDEFELEIELATAHFDPNLTDFDMSIAEAEFHTNETGEVEGAGMARPNVEENSDDEEIGEQANSSNDRNEASDEEYQIKQRLNERSFISRESLVDKIIAQQKSIRDLELNNEYLAKEREALVSDAVEMKQSIQQGKALNRRYVDNLEKAVAIKDKALTMASTERKRRKLVEIKAQKAIIRLQKSLELARLEKID